MEPQRGLYPDQDNRATSGRATELSSALKAQFLSESEGLDAAHLNPLEFSAFTQKLKAFERATAHLPFLSERINENVAFQIKAYATGQLHFYDLHRLAAEHVMSPKDFLVLYQRWVERVLSSCHAFVTVPTYVFIDQILQDHRWKTQYEVFRSGGKLDPERRASLEQHLFGYPRDPAINALRPVYGYISPNFHGIINPAGTHPPTNTTRVYGEVVCKIQPSAHARMTVCGQDTLLFEEYQPTPLCAAHSMSFGIDPLQVPRLSDLVEYVRSQDPPPELVMQRFLTMHKYPEVQIHGGLRLSEIKSVHISEENNTDPADVLALKNALLDFTAQTKSRYSIQVYDYTNRNKTRKWM